MRIFISLEFDEELCDPNDPSGVTDEGYDEICSALGHFGTDIVVSNALNPANKKTENIIDITLDTFET